MSDPLPPCRKLAVAGLGRIGWQHLEHATRAGFELVAVCDSTEALLTRAQDQWKVPGHPCYSDLLGATTADTIVIATPSHLHFEMAREAIQAGFHVILEKPAAVNAQEVVAMMTAAERHHRRITVCQSLRYQIDTKLMAHVIGQNLLGPLDHLSLRYNAGMLERTDWQIFSRFNGGQLSNLGVHLVDALLHVCSGHQPVSVYASLRRLIDRGDTEDAFTIMLEFNTGLVAEIEAYRSHLHEPVWHACGAEGSAMISGVFPEGRYTLVKNNAPTETRELTPADFPSNLQGFYEALYHNVVQLNHPAPITMQSVLTHMTVVDGIRTSAREKRIVHL